MLQIRLVPSDIKPGMDEQSIWEQACGPWKLKADRALEQDDVVVVDADDTVIAVTRLVGLEKTNKVGRYLIVGSLQKGDRRVGRPSTHAHRSRNSIQYN